jgi:O-antigen/teichoic acid export membrane protein
MTFASLIGKLAGYVGARFIGAALGFLSQIVLARFLPQADVGTVLMGMSAAAFVSLATHGGYALLAFTHLPKLAFLGRSSITTAFHKIVLSDTVLWSLLLFAALFIAWWAIGFSDPQTIALLFGCICSPASSLMRYNAIIASSDRQVTLSYVPDFLVRPGLFLFTLLLLSGLKVEASPVLVLTVFVAITYAVSIGLAVILGRKGLNLLNLGWPRKRQSRQIRNRALSLMIVSAVMLAFADIVTLLAAFLLPEHDVAIVGVTMRLAAIAGFILQAGQSFILPDFSDAVLKRDDTAANAILLKLNFATLGIITAGMLGALLLGHFVLRLFGADYVQGWLLLILFMIGQSIRAMGGMNQNILQMEGRQLRTTGACLAALAVLVVTALVLCRAIGFVGMGYAVVLAELVWLVSLAVMAQRFAGRRGDLLWLLARRK